MICLRCGYCCKHLFVAVVEDPERGIVEDNLVVHLGEGKPCIHLKGDKPGEYSCSIHEYDWYNETPCYDHTQIERENSLCRVGAFKMSKKKAGKK